MIPHLLKEKSIFLVLFFLICSIPSFAFADAEKIFKENSKSVVVVITFDNQGKPQSQGSGFIIRSDGAVVTNYHVISNARDIKIKAGNKILDVEGIIHKDKDNDLVIIKAKGENLPTVRLGDIEKEIVGEKIYVISSPKGLENTISDGLLSGIREITAKKKILQISAPISSGSSGSPVFNKNGEVIGIATFLLKGSQNLNFAMPVNLIKNKLTITKITKQTKSAIEDYTKTAEYWFNIGLAYSQAGKYQEAVDAFKKAVKIKPGNAAIHLNLGLVYARLGRHREAKDSFKQAIKIKPDDEKTYYNLGLTYKELLKWEDALYAFKQAVKIKPGNAAIHANLGIVYATLGRHREAKDAFWKAIKISPFYEGAFNELGVSYSRSGKFQEAIDSFKQAIKIKPDDEKTYYNLGLAYRGLLKYREAIDAFKQAVRIEPDHARAHYMIGLTYMLKGDNDSALDQYKILKDLDKARANDLFDLIYP